MKRGVEQAWAPLALAALTVLAAWPLLRLGYPTVGDGLNHFYRLVQLDHLLRAGVWYPRWATDMAYGFGYPLFNYYSPLAYYLGALLHALGLSYAGALLGVYVAGLALAVTGAYALAAERWGATAGLVAAAAYGLAPYFYFNALARGALPETVGLGLLPWVLWAYVRLASRPSPARFGLAAGLNAVLVLTHLLSAVLAAPLVVLVVLLEGPRAPGTGRKEERASYPLLITNYLLSLALAAFFLLPALFELSAVQVSQLTSPGDLDFQNNFLALHELFAWPRPYDARLVFNAVPPSLSLAAVAVAALGLAMSRLWRKAPATTPEKATSPQRHPSPSGRRDRGEGERPFLNDTRLLTLACLALLFLTLPLSVTLWERLPLLSMIQFPWRLVGPASLVLALLAGTGVARATTAAWAQRRGMMPAVMIAVLSLLWLGSLTWSYGPASTAPATANLNDLRDYERTAGQLGTTSAGEFLPAAVRALPDPHALDAAYAAGRPTERLAPPPAGVSVLSQTAQAASAAAEVEAAAPARLTFNVFHYPGWQAAVDGQPAPITASDPHGLITVSVPAGRHHVAIRFGSTPLRAAAAIFSLLALAGVVVIARRLAPGPSSRHSTAATLTHLRTYTLPFALTALLLLLTRAALLDGTNSPFSHSRFDGAAVAGVDQPFDVNFDDQLVLIGLDGPPASVAADGEAALTLYWRAQTVPAADYAATVQVLDAAGNLFGQSDSQHPGRAPTSRWRTDQYAQDAHRLRLLPGTPPGSYRLVAGVYQVDGPALPVLDANHIPQGQLADLGTLTVTAARRAAVPDPAHPLEARLGPLSLLGYSLNAAAPQAGDELHLTLFWRAEAAPRPDVAVRLTLAGADGAVLIDAVQPPAPPAYPTSAWAAGAVVRSPWRLRLPATVPAGPATLTVSLVPVAATAGAPLAGPLEIATLDVRVPARTFTVPAMQQPLNAKVGAQVTLLGYDLAPTGTLTLYWQTTAPLDASYKVFVHVLDNTDNLLAQADTVPAGGARPTTGWLPGEVVADAHALPLTGGTRLAVGLYDETTGERLGRAVLALP